MFRKIKNKALGLSEGQALFVGIVYNRLVLAWVGFKN